jgi:hypothetical protein
MKSGGTSQHKERQEHHSMQSGKKCYHLMQNDKVNNSMKSDKNITA